MKTLKENDRKCVHLKLKSRTHFLLKQKLKKNDLSIQEIMEYICSLVVDNDEEIGKIIKSYVVQKSENKVKLVKDKIPVKDILNFLETQSPLNKG